MLKIKKKLGEGSFSKVYEIESMTGKKYAVKMEDKNFHSYLEEEANIHLYLYNKDLEKKYILPVYNFYKDEKYNYLLMEKLSYSLGDVIKKIGVKFDNYSLRNIAVSLIENLKFIHENGICHCDIKPENIMMTDDYQKIYLIDYGLSRYFMRDGKHIPFKINVNNGGTLRYMSVHVNNKVQMSRRDDLISLGYVLVYLQKNHLPWQEIDSKDRFKKVADMKSNCNFEDLCQGCVPELKKYLDYCYKLEFDEKPDYEFLLKLFKENAID